MYVCMYAYIYIWSHPPHDPPEPFCRLFVYNTMSPNAFSEVINHWYLRGFLHFTYTDLCLLCSFWYM